MFHKIKDLSKIGSIYSNKEKVEKKKSQDTYENFRTKFVIEFSKYIGEYTGFATLNRTKKLSC